MGSGPTEVERLTREWEMEVVSRSVGCGIFQLMNAAID